MGCYYQASAAAPWADTFPTLWDRHPGLQGLGLGAALQSEARGVLMPRHDSGWLKTPARARWWCETLGADCEDGRKPPRLAWTQWRVKASMLNSTWLRARLCCLRLAMRLRAITALLTSPEFRPPSKFMRIHLLRRLRVPFPDAPQHRRCGVIWDLLADRRAACSAAGVLGPRCSSGKGGSACLPGRRCMCRGKSFLYLT